MEPSSKSRIIGIVGPCGSGKTTLSKGLEKSGYSCRHIAQEHSYVPAMWKLIARPDVLIYLNATFEVSTARAKLNWREKNYTEQLRRLSHAHRHAHLIIETDHLSAEQVLQKALDYLNKP